VPLISIFSPNSITRGLQSLIASRNSRLAEHELEVTGILDGDSTPESPAALVPHQASAVAFRTEQPAAAAKSDRNTLMGALSMFIPKGFSRLRPQRMSKKLP
jgi:hypothetical protein